MWNESWWKFEYFIRQKYGGYWILMVLDQVQVHLSYNGNFEKYQNRWVKN